MPILRAGNTLGVLVVQNRARRTYSEEEEEALQTTAMVLAEMIASGELSALAKPGAEPAARRAAAPRPASRCPKASRSAMWCCTSRASSSPISSPTTCRRNCKRLDDAIATLRADLDVMLERGDVADGGEHRDVLEAYRMFAYDRGWLHRMREAVLTGLTAEAAVERVQSDTRARMLRQTDPYLRERLHDLDDLANRLMRQLIGQDHAPGARAAAGERHPGRALDGPGGAARLRPQAAARPGAGGRRPDLACRRSWRARSASPAVGEIANATGLVDPGDAIIVDGTTGEVHVRPPPDMETAYVERVRLRARRQAQYRALRDKPCVTKDGEQITLMLNAGLLVDLPHIDETGAAGIGLFRTELQFMVAADLPAHQRAALALPRGARCRRRAAGDVPHPRYRRRQGAALYAHLSRRRTRRSAGARSGSASTGRACCAARSARCCAPPAGASCKVMFPMVATVEEFDQAKALVERELTHLRRHGHKLPERVEVGTMLEVPSLLYQLDELLERVDFLSVGSNDLMQFLYAADRGNTRVAERFDPLSAPVLRALERHRRQGDASTTSRSRCAANWRRKPIGALALVALGYRSLSLSPSALGPVKAMLLDLDCRKAEKLLQPLIDSPAGSVSIRERLQAFAEAEGLQL